MPRSANIRKRTACMSCSGSRYFERPTPLQLSTAKSNGITLSLICAPQAANFLRRCGVRLDLELPFSLTAVLTGSQWSSDHEGGRSLRAFRSKAPQSRATHIVQDAGATLVITEAVLHREDWPADTQVCSSVRSCQPLKKAMTHFQ